MLYELKDTNLILTLIKVKSQSVLLISIKQKTCLRKTLIKSSNRYKRDYQ